MVRHQEAMVGWKPYRNSPQVASARLRCFGPLAMLRKQGCPVEIYRPQNQHRYRVVILQKLYDPEHQELAKRLQAQGTRVVFDLCDNHLYTAGEDKDLGTRADDLRRMLAIADTVTVPTPTLAQYLPCPSVVIRDGVEPHRPRRPFASLFARRRERDCLELLWFGISGDPRLAFGMCDLLGIADILQGVALRTSLRLTIVSNSRSAYDKWVAPLALPTRYIEWKSHNDLCRLLPRHDVCLIPVRPTPYTLCKSANRLALSLSLGVPVIATGIPSYMEFRDFCTLDDWEGGLQAAVADRDAWKSQAMAGQAYVSENHMMEHAVRDWGQFLEGILPREVWHQPWNPSAA